MTIKDYEFIQWYLNFIFWILELTIILFVIRKRKYFSTFFFVCFLVESMCWFCDTNFILFNLYRSFPRTLYHAIQTFVIFYACYLFFLLVFYTFINNKKVKSWIFPIAVIGTITSLFILFYNLKNGIYFTHNIAVVHYVSLVPLSIYGLFEINSSEQVYKWNLSPSYLFFCGIMIQFLGNSSYDLFAPWFMKREESLLSIVMTIRLFVWIAFCLFFIAGLYQLGRNNKR